MCEAETTLFLYLLNDKFLMFCIEKHLFLFPMLPTSSFHCQSTHCFYVAKIWSKYVASFTNCPKFYYVLSVNFNCYNGFSFDLKDQKWKSRHRLFLECEQPPENFVPKLDFWNSRSGSTVTCGEGLAPLRYPF